MDAKDVCLELQILELFNQSKMMAMGPTDVERFTGVSKGTVSPRLKALAEAGYLQADGAGKYRLAGRVFAMAIGYMGVCMAQIDQAQEVLDANLSQIRDVMKNFIAAFPGQPAAAPVAQEAQA